MDQEQYALMYEIEDWHWWYAGMREISGALLSSAPQLPARPRILDAGCGTGGTTAWLAGWGPVVGIDLAPEGLEFCRQRGLDHLARASVQQLPFADAAFDLVTSFDVIYHLDVQRDSECLREFYRVLRPQGHLLLRVPAGDWLRGSHDRAVHTRHRYSAGEVREKLLAVGFIPERLTYANCLLFPLAVAKRLAEVVLPAPDDLGRPGQLANRIFGQALAWEARLVARRSLPWGLSVMALARKG